MKSSTINEDKPLRLMRLLLTELCESERNLSKKAIKMKVLIENAMTQDLSALTPEEQVTFSNAFAHYILLAEDPDPLQASHIEVKNISFITSLIQLAEESVADVNLDSAFRKRAISLLWLTFNYEDLKSIFTKINLSNFETDDYLFSPTQRIMKFHLFANQLSELLGTLPSTEEVAKAQASLSRLQLRTKAIAAITNNVFTSTDPGTHKTLLKSLSDVFVRKIISLIITKVLQKEPSENFGALTIDIRNEIQKELAEVYKVSSTSFTLWKEQEVKEEQQNTSSPQPVKT